MVQRPIVDGALTDVARLHCASTSISAMRSRSFLKNLDQAGLTMIGEVDDGLHQSLASYVSIESAPKEFNLVD